MRRFSAQLGFVAIVVAVVAVVSTFATMSACPPAPHAQPPACAAAIGCYFGTDAAHDLGAKIPGLANRELFLSTYGENGSCWTGDDALAHACEDRCRGLLVQGCVVSYNDDGGTPFCDPEIACSLEFAEECQDRGDAQSTCPSTTTPVAGPDGGPAHFPDGGGIKFEPLPCSAPGPANGHFGFGCCLEDGIDPVDGGCPYTYQDPKDCRDPKGNVRGDCPK